jgi:hypothetical protein
MLNLEVSFKQPTAETILQEKLANYRAAKISFETHKLA